MLAHAEIPALGKLRLEDQHGGHPWFCSQFEVSLDYMKLLKKKKKNTWSFRYLPTDLLRFPWKVEEIIHFQDDFLNFFPLWLGDSCRLLREGERCIRYCGVEELFARCWLKRPYSVGRQLLLLCARHGLLKENMSWVDLGFVCLFIFKTSSH